MRVDGLLWENAEENVIEIQPESVIWVDGREDIPRALRNLARSRYVVSKMELDMILPKLLDNTLSVEGECQQAPTYGFYV